MPPKNNRRSELDVYLYDIWMIYELPAFFPLQDIYFSLLNKTTKRLFFVCGVDFLRPSLPSSQLRDQRISIQSGGSVSGPVPVMTHNNCPEPANLGRFRNKTAVFLCVFPGFWCVCLFFYWLQNCCVSLILERWQDFFGGFRRFLRWDWGRKHSKAFNKHPFDGRMGILKELITWVSINPENSWIHSDSHNRTGSCLTKKYGN